MNSANSENYALAADGLSVTYGRDARSREVLRNVAIRVRRGEVVSVVGPSGAGKTTLLRCLAGLQRPTSGSVHVHSALVSEPPRQIGVVFQDYGRSLMPWMHVGANVCLPLRSQGVVRKERQLRARKALCDVGLDDVWDRYPWQLSGGMQQRVAIARALAYQPEVLLMDEPFASVDAQSRAELEDLTLRVRDEYGMSVVVVTHDIDEAVYMSERVFVLGGKPASVIHEEQIELLGQRSQIETKQMSAFNASRSRILKLIQA